MKKLFLLLCLISVGAAAQTPIPYPQPPYNPVNISFNSGSPQTIVAAPSAGGVCVYGLVLTNTNASTTTTVSIYQDGGSTAVFSVYLAAGGGTANFPLRNTDPKYPYFTTNAKTGFVITSSSAVQINGGIYAAICP